MTHKQNCKKITGRIVKIIKTDFIENSNANSYNEVALREYNRYGCMKRSYANYNQHYISGYDDEYDLASDFWSDNRINIFTVMVEYNEHGKKKQRIVLDIKTEANLRIGQKLRLLLFCDETGATTVQCDPERILLDYFFVSVTFALGSVLLTGALLYFYI